MLPTQRSARIHLKAVLILAACALILAAGLAVAYKVRKRVIANRALAAGKAAFDRQDWPEAARQLKRYLSKYSDDTDTLEQYGRANLAIRPTTAESLASAIGAYRRLVRHRPDDLGIARQLLNLYVRRGEFDQAVLVHERIAARNDPESALWFARAMFGLRRAAEASAILEKLVQADPKQDEAWCMLSQIDLLSTSELSQRAAWERLEQAVRHAPTSARARAARAAYQRSLAKDPAAARLELEAGDSLPLDDPLVRLDLAEEWMQAGQWERVAAHLSELDRVEVNALDALEVDPASFQLARYMLAGRLHLARQDTAAGAALAERALADLKDRPRTLFLPLALELFVQAAKPTEARACIDDYKKSVEAAGTHAAALADPLDTLEALVRLAEDRPYPAIEILDSLTVRNSDNAEAWRLLAMACARTGQPERSAKALEEYLTRRPGDGAAALRLAQAYAGRDWERTRKFAAQATQSGVTDPQAAVLRIEAELQLSAGRPGSDRAAQLLAELDEICKVHSAKAQAHALRARFLAQLDRREEGIAALEAALPVVDDPWPVARLLVTHYREKGEVDRALSTCRSAIEHRPDLAAPRIGLADLQALEGRKADSLQTLQDAVKALADNERAAARSTLAQRLLAEGDRTQAVELLRAAAAERPDDAGPRLELLALTEIQSAPDHGQPWVDDLKRIEGEHGQRWQVEQCAIWLRSGEWEQRSDQLIEMLSDCLKTNPAWTAAALNLGLLYERREDPDQAESTYRTALSAAPRDAALAARLLSLLERQRRFAAAKEVLDQLPEWAAGEHRVGVALGRRDYAAATEALKRRVESDPRDVAALVLLARLTFAEQKDPSAALRLLDDAQSIAPEAPSVLAARVAIMQSAGRSEEALALIDREVERRADFATYQLRAEFHAAGERYELAEADYRRLSTFADSAADGFAMLGSFYDSTGRHPEAAAAWRAGLEKDPLHYGNGRQLARSLLLGADESQRSEGRRLLNALLGERPADPDLLALHAAALLNADTPDNRKEAAEVLERVVKIAPYHTRAYLTLIRLARQNGDSRGAADLASRGLASNPNDHELRLAAAQLDAESGDLAAARDKARMIADADPKNVAARNMLASLALNSNDLEAARSNIAEILQVAPLDPTVQLAQAELLAREGRRQEAIQSLEEFVAQASAPRRPEHFILLADLHREAGNLDACAQWIEEAGKAAPDAVAVDLARLRWLEAGKQFDEMARRLTAATSDPKQIPFFLTGASMLASTGDERHLKTARGLFQRVVALEPNGLGGLLGDAQVAYRLGDAKAAAQAYERILSLEPYHQQALNDLAWILGHDLADPEKGLEWADRAVLHYPNDPHLLDTRGALLALLDRYDDARRDLERCIKLSAAIPRTEASARLHLGRLLAKRGEMAEARSQMAAALELDRAHQVLNEADRAEVLAVVKTP